MTFLERPLLFRPAKLSRARAMWPKRSVLAVLFGAGGLLLVPWIVLLIHVLPSTHRAPHWDIAWAGFDAVLAVMLAAVAVTTWRNSDWLEGAATATAALLFVDAWFDVLTSSSSTELAVALTEAALVELPMAVVCVVLARSAERRLASSTVHVGMK